MIMHAATISEWLVMNEEHLLHELQQAAQMLGDFQKDVVLDFSSVRRIDAAATRELEKVAGIADVHSVKVSLRGINIDIYRVLKLVNLASRFSFLT
jgi:anti-anti-sigma regulatory factor